MFSRMANNEKNEELDKVKSILSHVLRELGASDDSISQSLLNINSMDSIYSFPNNFMIFDFGDDINQSFTSSTVEVHFTSLVALFKVYVKFRNEVEKSTMVLVYNADLNFIDYQFNEDNPGIHKYYKKLCDTEFELKRVLISELNRLSTVFKHDASLLDNFFDQIYLTKNYYYSSVGKNTKNMKFNLSYADQKFTLYTNVFSIDVDYFNSSNFNISGCVDFDIFTKIKTVTLIFQSISSNRYEIKQDIISFDNNLNLFKYQKKQYVDRELKTENIPVDGIDNQDFLLLLNLKFYKGNEINHILPEIKIPSAYNFYSEDFKNRLDIAKMLLY